MFHGWRLKKIHARFLESCRNLNDGRSFWAQASGLRRWILEFITPIPLLGLEAEGKALLDALAWLESNCRVRPLSEEVIRHYHRFVYALPDGNAGAYRKHEIIIEHSAVKRRPAQKIAPAMKALDVWLAAKQMEFDSITPIDDSALFSVAVETHHKIGLIHPFADANGRVARLSMNHLLRRYGFGYVIFPPLSESPPFWDALQEAHKGKLSGLVEFARTCVQRV
jgi:Fic family protein